MSGIDLSTVTDMLSEILPTLIQLMMYGAIFGLIGGLFKKFRF